MRLATGVLLWLVAAAAATAVGLAAVAAIGTDIFGGGRDPLSQSEVDELLASRTAATPTAPRTTPQTTTQPTTTTTAPTTTVPSAPVEKATVTEGGTVIAACTAEGLVRIVSASPAQGYQVDPDDDDLDDHPSVKFQSGEREVEVRLRCVDGLPVPEIRVDD